MNKTNWLVERDGEEIARFRTFKEARQFLEIDGKVSIRRYGRGGLYEIGRGDIWINRETEK